MPIFSTINNLLAAGKQNRMAKKINPVDQQYTESPIIQGLYSEGKNLYQGRMAGATQAEQGISTGEANATAFGERNATDASQLLSFGASVYGQGDDQRINLAVKEAQDKQGRFGIYSNVSEMLNNERDKVFQDKLRKYYDDLNYKRALEGAAMQNKANAWGALDSNIMSAASLFMGGGGWGGETNKQVVSGLESGGVTRNPYTGTMPRTQTRNPYGG